MRHWDGLSSRMECEPDVPMPTEGDIDRDTDEAYALERDQFSVVSIINRAKENKQ